MMEEVDAGAVGGPAQLSVVSEPKQLSTRLPSQLEATQRQVDEVVQVMRKNLERIEARGEHLDEMQMRAAALETQAQEFNVQSTRLQKQMWWKNMKWTLIAIGTVTTIVAIIIIILATTLSK